MLDTAMDNGLVQSEIRNKHSLWHTEGLKDALVSRPWNLSIDQQRTGTDRATSVNLQYVQQHFLKQIKIFLKQPDIKLVSKGSED